MTSYLRKLCDIGVNLSDPMFRGIYHGTQKHPSDMDAVMTRSLDQGVSRMIITGTNLSDSKEVIDFASGNESLYSTVGVHPTRCGEFEDQKQSSSPDDYMDQLRQLIQQNKGKVVAVGECGLDYDRTKFCPISVQKKYFEKQLDLAEESKLPLFLHSRKAADDVYSILNRNRDRLSGAVVHSFDGTVDEANRFINDFNFYIGINGCSLKTQQNLDVVSQLPLDRILIETDCPWCEIKPTHASFQYVKTRFEAKKKEKFQPGFQVKGRNEPANLIHVLEVIAGLKEEDMESVAKAVTENTQNLFNL